MSNEPSVEYQLGFLGMSWTRVEQLKSDLFDRAALMHQMGAVTKAAIVSDEAKDSGKRLCFSADDNKYWIEHIPSHHVDWDMDEDEWNELRSVLWWSDGKYIEKLKAAGKLGTHAPPPPPPPPLRGGGVGGAGGGESVSFQPGGFTATGRRPQPPRPQPWPRRDPPTRYGPPMPVSHKVQKPLDAHADTWRCEGCGTGYRVTSGFAICPNDPDPPTGSKVGGGPVIA